MKGWMKRMCGRLYIYDGYTFNIIFYEDKMNKCN